MATTKTAIERERRAMHDRLEELSKALLFPRVSALFQDLGFDRYDMHYQAKIGNRQYSKTFLNRLKEKFPEVNMDWFVNNRGSMLLDVKKNIHVVETSELFMVRDNAMAPTIIRGDELVCRAVKLSEIVVFGETYIIQIGQQSLVRYLFKDESGYILRSNNPETTPEIKVKSNEIASVKKVVKIIRALE
jgi:hypothetical protein